MLLTEWAAVSLQPPRDPTTKGTNGTPTERQASAWVAIFLFSPTERAWPWVVAAPVIVSACMVEITVTSSAAGRPRLQCGRYRSALGDSWIQGSGKALLSLTKCSASFTLAGILSSAWDRSSMCMYYNKYYTCYKCLPRIYLLSYVYTTYIHTAERGHVVY